MGSLWMPKVKRLPPVHRRGFALMDVMIGGIVLAIALTAIFSLSSRALHSQMIGEQRMQASMLLDQLLNQVLAVGPDEYSNVFATSGTADPPFENFEYEIVIDDEGSGHPFAVTARVYWMAGGREIEASVETRIAPMLGEVEDGEREPEFPVVREEDM